MEKNDQSTNNMVIQGVEHIINNSDFLILISKRVLEMYKASILVNYNQKRSYNRIPGSAEEYDMAVGVFSQKSMEFNQFIQSFYQQIDGMDFEEIKKGVSKYLEARGGQVIDLTDENIKTALHSIIDKFRINEYYNELFQLYFESLPDEVKSELSNFNVDSAVEKAISMGYLGSGYPYDHKSRFKEDLKNAENGNLNTIGNFLEEISKATTSVKNTLKNSEVYSQMDSHHRVI